ncbi:dihydroorotase [candidate division KSB1 bacterium]|nr:dihydroorotase [candidate division KSB1 bacterium]
MKKPLRKSQTIKNTKEMSNFKPAKKVLLKNASIIDGQNDYKSTFDLLIIDGKIKEMKPEIVSSSEFDGKIFDLSNKLLLPGFLDMHVHFREPGREDEETILSGARAAMTGGFTAVCTMPNTQPVTDNREIVEFIRDEISNHLISIYPVAAITRGQKGDELVEMAELIDAGVVAFSDDGKSVANSLVLRRAMEYARMFDVPIIEHCEDAGLAAGGAMHEGFVSTNLGMPGIPSIAEDVVVARNIQLAEYTKSKIHIAHISSAGAVELVRRAKEKNIQVTAEAAPHHFTLTDETIRSFDANFKMNPPLRSQKHIEAIVAGLKDGTIDAIATDHAPHSIEEKQVEFAAAPFGIIGLETAIGLIIKQLIKPGILNWNQAVEKLSINPYRIIGIPAPQIKERGIANLTIIDPEAKWKVNKDELCSKSRNTPFDGWEFKGNVIGVFNNCFYSLGEKQK